jgi:hypothetical protein
MVRVGDNLKQPLERSLPCFLRPETVYCLHLKKSDKFTPFYRRIQPVVQGRPWKAKRGNR